MVKVTGMKSHKARLRRIRGPQMIKAASAALKELASTIEVQAANSITTGGGINSPPSAPGTPPNSKTDHLAGSIRSDKTGELSYEVSATAEYAAAQEFGNSRLPARPYMQPAAAKVRPEAAEKFKQHIKRITGGSA